jgi:hypothetical protein
VHVHVSSRTNILHYIDIGAVCGKQDHFLIFESKSTHLGGKAGSWTVSLAQSSVKSFSIIYFVNGARRPSFWVNNHTQPHCEGYKSVGGFVVEIVRYPAAVNGKMLPLYSSLDTPPLTLMGSSGRKPPFRARDSAVCISSLTGIICTQ